MSLKWRFIIAPLVGIVLVLILMISFYRDLKQLEQNLENITQRDLQSALLYSQLASQWSINHADIYNLLRLAEQSQDEGLVYDEGKSLLLKMHELNKIVLSNEVQKRLQEQSLIDTDGFIKKFKTYEYGASNSIILATINLTQSKQKMIQITGIFNQINSDLLALVKSTELQFHENLKINNIKSQNSRERFFILALITFISIIITTITLAHLVSKKLQSSIVRLNELTYKEGKKTPWQKDEIKTLDNVIEQTSQDHQLLKISQEKLFKKQQNLEKIILNRTIELQKSHDKIEAYNEDLKQSKQLAEQASKSKSEFLAMMSHEIRTPMNAIIGFSELLEMSSDLSSTEREYLQIVKNSGNHLLTLINDVLEMSKIEAGRTETHINTIDLHELIKDMQAMFSLKCKQKHLKFYTKIHPEIPQWIEVDDGKLRQIIINLLGNATKFTQHGSVELNVNLDHISNDNFNLILVVNDSGPGIDEKEKHKVFGQFQQTQSSKTATEGTGLGLALSKSYAQLLGGDITFSSTLGKGTSFHLTIPSRKAHPDTTPTIKSTTIEKPFFKGSPILKALLADDTSTNIILLSKIIKLTGLDVITAENGYEVIEQYEKKHPNIIFMDLNMPEMDGYEAIHILRSKKYCKIPIIAVSASVFESDRKKVMEYGASDFLRKPFKKQEIFDILSLHLLNIQTTL